MIDFPNHPSPGQVFYAWKWDGEKWVMITTTGWAPLHSPDFTGMPTAPTPPPGSNDAKIATTAFVMEAIEHHIAGVSSFNHRTGHVFLELVDIVEAGGAPIHGPHFTGWPEAETAAPGTDSRIIATTEFVHDSIRRATDNIVNSWNRRTGDVELRWDDVEDVGGAPIREPVFLGFARGQTAPRRDETTRLANTIFVGRAIDDAREEIDEEIREVVRTSVRSWNQRTGHVTLRPSDLTAVGAAFLASPAFTGKPTAPTAPPDTNNQQLATTRYVDQAIRSNPGPPGAPGRPGEKGPPGPAGRGLVVVGHVARRQDLPRRDNEVGDIWTVGEDYEGFWWNGFVWLSLGFIRGARGPRGPAGPPTFIDDERPEDAERGDLWWNPEDRLFEIRVNGRWDQISPPISNVVSLPSSSSYEMRPTDDVVIMPSSTINRTLRLASWSDSTPGKTIRAFININDGQYVDLTIAPDGAGGAVLTPASGWGGAVGVGLNLRMFGPARPILVFFRHPAGSWYIYNDGLSVRTPYWWIPGTGGRFGDQNTIVPTPSLVPLVPAGTPTNAALQADATWQVPGTTAVQLGGDGASYNVRPIDDLIWFGNFATSKTLILPPLATVPSGKTIRIFVNAPNVGARLRIERTDGAIYMQVPYTRTNLSDIITSFYEITFPLYNVGTNFTMVKFGYGWIIYNEGRQQRATSEFGESPFPGLMPGPYSDTPSNAALQADMTWKVPGTKTVITSVDYTALPTDDWIWFENITAPVTLTLPSSLVVPLGKLLRVSINSMSVSGSLTIASPGPLAAFGGTPGNFNIVGGSYTIPGFDRGSKQILLQNIQPWTFINQSTPLLGTPVIPGLLPGPPAGTPASAVLHADMTWY